MRGWSLVALIDHCSASSTSLFSAGSEIVPLWYRRHPLGGRGTKVPTTPSANDHYFVFGVIIGLDIDLHKVVNVFFE